VGAGVDVRTFLLYVTGKKTARPSMAKKILHQTGHAGENARRRGSRERSVQGLAPGSGLRRALGGAGPAWVGNI